MNLSPSSPSQYTSKMALRAEVLSPKCSVLRYFTSLITSLPAKRLLRKLISKSLLGAVPNMRLKPKSVIRLMYLSSIPFIPQNIFLLQKYNFYMKSARKSTEILQIKIYLLLLQLNYQIKYLYMSKEKQETGYVYILTNQSFREDWVKIGKSSRPVDIRSKELDNTAVPLPFEIYATLKTSKYEKVEKLIHKTIDRLTYPRIRQNR